MSRDVRMTNIRKEPSGGWMIVLLMVVSFIIGYVDRMCQSFLSGCVLFFFFFSTIIFDTVVVDFDIFFYLTKKRQAQLVKTLYILLFDRTN